MKIADNIDFDLTAFRGQRALFQGASGSGKSNGARLLLEATYGTFQHLILDVEDEFHTLRTDKREYAIIGGEYGDAPLSKSQDPGELALTLLQVGVSTVLQVGDWTLEQKRSFVGRFLAGMMRAKADLWHPTVVMLDEAHLMVPQQTVTIASEAVTHLATAGRKRGFSAIFATQRLSLISKDVLGQCENKLLGRVEQSADRRAVADLLGFAPLSQEARDMQQFRPGEFYAVGPALASTPLRDRLYRAQTEAPKPGSTVVPSPSSKAIQAALAELAKASQAAEADKAKAAHEQAGTKSAPAAPADIQDRLREAEKRGEDRGYKLGFDQGVAKGEADLLARVRRTVLSVLDNEIVVGSPIGTASGPESFGSNPTPAATVHVNPEPLPTMEPKTRQAVGAPASAAAKQMTGDPLISPAKRRILAALRDLEAIGQKAPDKQTVAWFADASPKSSTYANNLGALRSSGLIDYPVTGAVCLTDGGREVEPPRSAPTHDHIMALVLGRLTPAQRRMLEVTVGAYPSPISSDQLAANSGASATSSTFANNRGRLRSLGLIEYPSSGLVRAADLLFPGGRRPHDP